MYPLFFAYSKMSNVKMSWEKISAELRSGKVCALNITTNTYDFHSTSILNICDNSIESNTFNTQKNFGWNGNVFAISKCDASSEIVAPADVFKNAFWSADRMYHSGLLKCARYGSQTSKIRSYFVKPIIFCLICIKLCSLLSCRFFLV